MTNRLCNWTYRDVTDFLQQKGFGFFDNVDHHIGQAWMNVHDNGEPNRIVEVKFTRTFYKSKALKRMIRQSGIPETEWVNWKAPEIA